MHTEGKSKFTLKSTPGSALGSPNKSLLLLLAL